MGPERLRTCAIKGSSQVGGVDGGDARPGQYWRSRWRILLNILLPLHKLLDVLTTMSSLSVDELFGIRGRVALVTGGCSGIGLMIAKVGAPS